jgi:hypothetical protein
MTKEIIDLTKCLSYLCPNDSWGLSDNDYSKLEWFSNTTQPTEAELIAVWPLAVEAEKIKNEAKISAKSTLLEKLGITEDEAKLLLS